MTTAYTASNLTIFSIFLFKKQITSFIHYDKYNTILEHVSTPVPTMDNSIQTYIYKYTYTGYAYIIYKDVQTERHAAIQT